ncbi:Uu.00g128500.m01.CDS01 [Anthostomella pinea]|uniref:Uu.00g128500.m01.CDS01 n=1 Tax=Anthostomella pinea TaxID=933095 RepID=A0AAI8VJ24_9PEZI|nr:Uu.00g128500.m01.CDS01 [Anthostomella pinea]
MAKSDSEFDPLWQDLDRYAHPLWCPTGVGEKKLQAEAIGQMLIMGWDGTEITPQIRNLIENHHLGSIILTAKNLKSAEQTASLVQELQTIAHQAGHPVPLLIALDQENGGVNSLFDEDYICQFPSAMGIAATGSPELAYSIAKATATEVSAVGVNVILGPVLDVLTNARHQPLGVRATGDDPQEASLYCIAAINGFKDAGVATCGKHFPSYGNLDFQGSSLDMPIITQTLEELSISALVPFRNAIGAGRLDAMFVGGCGIQNAGMNVMHACLSDQVVDDLLRNELGFNGVAISECLEMQSLIQEYGVKGGTVMAVEAGNDLVLLCRAHDVQLEAISGLKLGIENGIISKERIFTSLRRVLKMKSVCTSWQKALNPPGLSLLSKIHPTHLALSRKAYDQSITVVRNKDNLLPLSQSLLQEEELLLLTPLVKPLPASAATKSMMEKSNAKASSLHDKWAHQEKGAIMSGEGVFRELGKSIARIRHGKLLHTSYTANGLRPVHENLINRASAIIIVTADANRNLYQSGFTKHVAMMCHMLRGTGQKKSLIVVAVSSPYDFAMDKSIGTYVCTFDFTETAMASLVRALHGDFVPQGSMPGTMRKSKRISKNRQQWLVENYERDRDGHGLSELLKTLTRSSTPNLPYLTTSPSSFELFNTDMEEAHFVVRNSSTNMLYGFAATYFTKGIGIIGAIFVDPSKRNVSIGRSLHRRAMRALLQRQGIKKLQVGLAFPGVFPGIPADENGSMKSWFDNVGWDTQFPKRIANMVIEDLGAWTAPEGLSQSIQRANISFDLIHGLDNAESVLSLVAAHAGPEVVELYRFALQEKSCGVVRAKNAADTLLGTVIICRGAGQLSSYIPCLHPVSGEDVGGIVAPIVPASAQSTLLLQGLAFMGVRQNKAQKSTKSVLSWVLDETHDLFSAMGFEVQQSFDEVTNLPENDQ